MNAAQSLMDPSVTPAWIPVAQVHPPQSTSFWKVNHVRDRLSDLQETVRMGKAMQMELEILMKIQNSESSVIDGDRGLANNFSCNFFKELGCGDDLKLQESRVLDAANSLILKLKDELDPFRFILEEKTPWKEKSAMLRLSKRLLKSKRNKLWRKRKKKRIMDMLTKERALFYEADRKADEWRAREIAKDMALKKVEKMKEIAKLKVKEEKKRLECERDLVLMVERLQELRTIRIQRLKKQGHFLPEEDDKFLERIRQAVEEEERQAMAAADTDAAKDAIACAEESRRLIHGQATSSNYLKAGIDQVWDTRANQNENKDEPVPSITGLPENKFERQHFGGSYEFVENLPIEFYHYYHGSNADMGTLIEVRRTWDAYIRPGGSRIPGHWVLPPPPADEVWASYLVMYK